MYNTTFIHKQHVFAIAFILFLVIRASIFFIASTDQYEDLPTQTSLSDDISEVIVHVECSHLSPLLWEEAISIHTPQPVTNTIMLQKLFTSICSSRRKAISFAIHYSFCSCCKHSRNGCLQETSCAAETRKNEFKVSFSLLLKLPNHPNLPITLAAVIV